MQLSERTFVYGETLTNLHPADWILLLAYLGAITLLGAWIGRKQAGPADYFLGGRRMPGWAVLLSIVATETSTVTFLSLPGVSFSTGGDFRFLQITFGYIVATWARTHS